jgi:hypothetical protein
MGDFKRRFGEADREVCAAGSHCELVEEVPVGFVGWFEEGCAAVRAGISACVSEPG